MELGATYDPTMLQKQKAPVLVGVTLIASTEVKLVPEMPETTMADILMAQLWYEKARDLGSTEAAVRLERLRSVPNPRR